MPNQSVFADEWRTCLREHYKYTVQHDSNPRNLESLKAVLLRPNGSQPPIFTESELRELYIEATMRAEDMPDGFVPEEMLEAIQEQMAAEIAEQAVPETSAPTDQRTYQPHPLECQCPQCVEINLFPHDDEGQPLSADEVAELEERQAYEQPDDEDSPQQLTLF